MWLNLHFQLSVEVVRMFIDFVSSLSSVLYYGFQQINFSMHVSFVFFFKCVVFFPSFEELLHNCVCLHSSVG